MNELIQIQSHLIGNDLIDTVNSRELHSFLGVGKDFSTWIKDRIKQYDFVENQDFIKLPRIGELATQGFQEKIEYFISLDMAKELAMVERNEKGKQARKYFIECETRLRQGLPTSYLEALENLVQQEREKLLLTQKLTHEKQMIKSEHGKGIYGASIKQVNDLLNSKFKWQPLMQWCVDNDVEPYIMYLNSYGSLPVKIYPAQAWNDVYDIDLTKLF